MKLWQRWKQTAVHNKALVITSVLVAIGTLFYTVAAIVQIHLVNKNNAATSQQVDKLIEAANIQAAAAKRNASAAESFATEAKKQASKMSELAAHATAQALATNALAKQAKRYADSADTSLDWKRGRGLALRVTMKGKLGSASRIK